MAKKDKATDLDVDSHQGVEAAPQNLTAAQKSALVEAVESRYGETLQKLKHRMMTISCGVHVGLPTGSSVMINFFPTLHVLQEMRRVPTFEVKVPHPSGDGRQVTLTWKDIPAKVRATLDTFDEKKTSLLKAQSDALTKLEASIAERRKKTLGAMGRVERAHDKALVKIQEDFKAKREKVRLAYDKAINDLTIQEQQRVQSLEKKFSPSRDAGMAKDTALMQERKDTIDALHMSTRQKAQALQDDLDTIIGAAASEHSKPYEAQKEYLEKQYRALSAAKDETILRIKLNGAADVGMNFLKGLPSPEEVISQVSSNLKCLPKE